MAKLVLVTGASGYIAAWICKQLVEKGYRVRGTVRDDKKGVYLKNLLGDKFEYRIVEDLEKPNGFDVAFEGNDVDFVLHTASPFHLNAKDVDEDLIQPALNGTKSLLNAVKKANEAGSKIKRVVVTSSFAAIMNDYPPVYVYTEKDWNKVSVEAYHRDGKNLNQSDAYRCSKTLAEQAAWEFVGGLDKESPAFFDLATVNPPFVFGPTIHDVPSPDKLNTSVAIFWRLINGQIPESEYSKPFGNFCDVRDVAAAHIRAIEVPEAGGLRLAVSSGPFVSQDFLDVISTYPWEDKYKQRAAKVPKGTFGAGAAVNKTQSILSAERAKEVLGITPMSLKEVTIDMAKNLWDREDQEWSK